MQINVLPASNPSIFNRLVFPEMGPETRSWIEENFNRGHENLTELGRQFYRQAEDIYQRMQDNTLMKMARKMTRTVKGVFHPNTILYMNSIEEVQSAKPVMQRYLMAEPSLRKLYSQQRCDGYSDSYVDHEPGKIGEDHYDYRRVMNGIVVDYLKPDGEAGWRVNMYVEDLVDGDRELESDEQFAILNGHDLIKLALFKKIDPSDIFNGTLDL